MISRMARPIPNPSNTSLITPMRHEDPSGHGGQDGQIDDREKGQGHRQGQAGFEHIRHIVATEDRQAHQNDGDTEEYQKEQLHLRV